ncbi:hypothetical protein CJU89_0496 [Yarrowia sp. B02]|nr:hypothetical protein CJU89_0496 [Yarrowia sp. B02]
MDSAKGSYKISANASLSIFNTVFGLAPFEMVVNGKKLASGCITIADATTPSGKLYYNNEQDITANTHYSFKGVSKNGLLQIDFYRLGDKTPTMAFCGDGPADESYYRGVVEFC